MSRIYNENYIDDSKTMRVVYPKSREEWFKEMNDNKDKFPKPTFEDLIKDLESSLQIDLENLDQREYFKEDVPVKVEQIEGWVITDWDKIRRLKKDIGRKRYQLELLKSHPTNNTIKI